MTKGTTKKAAAPPPEPEETEPEEETEETGELSREDREKRLSSAYNRASQALRDAHRDEFNRLYSEHAEDLGVTWKPRLRPEEKAEQELLSIFEEFPHLKEQYAPAREADDDEPDEPDDDEDEEEEPESG